MGSGLRFRHVLPWAALGIVSLASSCTFLIDASGEQCASTTDCIAKGPAFASTVCSAEKTCVFSCSTNKSCIQRNNGEPALCRKADGVCTPLKTAECTKLLAEPIDLENENFVLYGGMLPLSGPNAGLVAPIVNAVDLARKDFRTTSNGIAPQKIGGPTRPMGVLFCHDIDDPIKVARHLVETIRVPAIIGPAFSGIFIKVATEVTIPKGVLTISASATTPFITKLPDNDLAWRTAPPDTTQAIAMAKLIEKEMEAEIRSALKLATDAPIRVAVAHKSDGYGVGLAGALFDGLRFNSKSAAENGTNFKQFDYGDPTDPAQKDTAAAKAKAAVEGILAFKPHILITVGTSEGVTTVFAEVEKAWREPYKARHILADGAQLPELLKVVKDNADLIKRVRGTIAGTSNPNFDKFASAYRSAFTGSNPDSYAAAAYDATYLLNYAVMGGGGELSGAALAKGLKKMVSGAKIEVGTAHINSAFDELRAGKGIDFNGASGPLDFNVSTGEADADIQLWCIAPDASGFVNSGAYFNAASKMQEGTTAPKCPPP